jgi:hypothetical protein
MHADLLFPSKYLKAADLHGQDVTLTIYRLQAKEKLVMVGGKTDIKPILFFEEVRDKAAASGKEEKSMVLNVTNKNSIVAFYGTETDDWIGKRITIYAAPCEQSPSGIAIRVRPTMPLPKSIDTGEVEPAPNPVQAHIDSVANPATTRETYLLNAECQTCHGKYPAAPVNKRTGCCDGCESGEADANQLARDAIGLNDADIEGGG